MATTTTRLGLTKPDFVDVVDISELNNNADDIDAAVGAAVVTSTTRPGTPWSGQIIFETDTNNTLVWDGTAWEAVAGTISPGSITATELASDAVTTAKILDANVTTAKIADANVTSAKLGPGTILQVVQGVKTDTFTAGTSNTWLDITDLSATITPRATSSKILVITDVKVGTSTADNRSAFVRLTGGNTASYVGDAGGSKIQSIAGATAQLSGFNLKHLVVAGVGVYLDSPNTTSATTYQVQLFSGNGTGARVNQSAGETDTNLYGRFASSITVMEIAG